MSGDAHPTRHAKPLNQGTSYAADFGAAVAAVLRLRWGAADAVPRADLEGLWPAAVEQGWLELGGAGALDFLAVTVRELGRVGCPFPVADTYLAAELVDATTRTEIELGELRVVVDPGSGHLDGAVGATHVLMVDREQAGVELARLITLEARPGLAVPMWSRATTRDHRRIPVDPDLLSAALARHRLARAVRALAAAERTHELAVEHARVRRQFGRTIGAFGAVQQRVASCQIEIGAAWALVDDAVTQTLSGHSSAVLAADLAVTFVADVVTTVMAGAQHTLGAIGYFEEHEAPWLFRRVHADAALLRDTRPEVAASLVEGAAPLPAVDPGPVAERFRGEVRALLARHAGPGPASYDVEALRAEMADQGLFGLGWPHGEGGRVASVEEQVVLNEEMKYAGGPVDRAMSAAMLIGHSLVRHGTAAQKRELLPLIRAGQMAFCLGYSEPEAGSDLASIRTRAERRGERWVINGQKLWTTRGNTASHVWLAVRTDPDATPRQAGITIFLVPMDTPGITVHDHVALSGEISCTVFYDNVTVPDSMRVGEVNDGWRVITDALSAERVIMGGVASSLLRGFDDLVDHLRGDPARLGLPGSHARHHLSSLAARLQAARVLVVRATRSMSHEGSGALARLNGPMAAVLSGDLAEEFGEAALELLGPDALLGRGVDGALADGAFEAGLRLSPMYVIGGGTNDIQRALIARGLGLARE